MIDCYQVLGVSPHASSAEIRAAYLARMKLLHPDILRDGGDSAAAGEITAAYWQLRDGARRAEHDRLLFAGAKISVAPAKAAAGSKSGRSVSLTRQRHPPSGRKRRSARPMRPSRRRLEPLRTGAGLAAFALAVAGFGFASTYLAPQGQSRPRAAGIVEGPMAAIRGLGSRRAIKADLADAAATEFRDIIRRSGMEGARLYARQCLTELAARPTMTLLDYCLAFDDEAAAWERAVRPFESRLPRYFAEEQRFGRYMSIVEELAPGSVRDAMLTDAGFFASRGS